MRQLHRTVLVGYWTEEPIAFATDAYVFDYLLADHDPEIHIYNTTLVLENFSSVILG
jgi:hypothetical protein